MFQLKLFGASAGDKSSIVQQISVSEGAGSIALNPSKKGSSKRSAHAVVKANAVQALFSLAQTVLA